MSWINLAQDRDHWHPLEHTIMNLLVPWNIGKFLSNWATGDSLEGLISAIKINHCGGRLLADFFMLVSCLNYSSTLKMKATCSSKTSSDFKRTTRRYSPEDRTLHNHRCENLRSYISWLVSTGDVSSSARLHWTWNLPVFSQPAEPLPGNSRTKEECAS
jgi:hypothetical protein